jgi:sorbitol-specific phosphotransferase system component IIC
VGEGEDFFAFFWEAVFVFVSSAEGDFAFVVVAECFFFRGVGVGVGVVKILFTFSPNVCSAAAGIVTEPSNVRMISMRKSMSPI